MKIKRYVVKEMREAIRLIKQDLGAEAIIVSTYKVSAKGLLGFFAPRLLEVTAVLDETPEVELNVNCPPAQMVVAAAGATQGQNIAPKDLTGAYPGITRTGRARNRSLYLAGGAGEYSTGCASLPFEEDIVTNHIAARNVKGRRGKEEGGNLFEMMVNKHVEEGAGGSLVLRWRRVLLDLGIQENITDYLLSGLCDEQNDQGGECRDIYYNLLNKIAYFIETSCHLTYGAKVMTFMGPPGAGKTTTLAKLATRFSLYEQKNIALIAIYSYRIGALEQLQSYGDFLGIPVEVVMTPAELAKALKYHSDKDAVFIDTVGRSARNSGQVLELKGFLDAVEEPQDVFLVLSAASKNRDLIKTAGEFRRIGYSKFIFTKLDETETCGSIINLVCNMGAPVAYLADGQSIPDDIYDATPKKIAKILFRGVDPDEVMATCWNKTEMRGNRI